MCGRESAVSRPRRPAVIQELVPVAEHRPVHDLLAGQAHRCLHGLEGDDGAVTDAVDFL